MYLLLANPEAGGRRFQKVKNQLLKTLERLKVKFELVELPNLIDAQEMMKKHIKTDTTGIVAVGGNATVNTVINALADESIPMGIIPVGKTNYLAHSLGIKGWRAACGILAAPARREQRLGKIGKHYFVDRLEILCSQNLLAKYLRREGPLKRFLGSTKVAPRQLPCVHTEIKLDDDLKVESSLQKLAVVLNNEKGGKKLCLELVTDGPKNPTRLWADEIAIEGDKKMPVLMGNEEVAHTPVEIKGMTKYIELLVPQTSKPRRPERRLLKKFKKR